MRWMWCAVAAVLAVAVVVRAESAPPAGLGTLCSAVDVCDGGLVCRQVTYECGLCVTDAECQAVSGHSVCGGDGLCVRAPLFPLSLRDVAVTGVLAVAAALASGAGIGGGGLFVPLFVLGMGFGPSTAIPLSKSAIFGAAVANFLVKGQARHPAANRPLIDYSVVLMLEPMTLAGAILGVMLNVILPSWIVLLMLIALLSVTTLRTWRKAQSISSIEASDAKRSPAPSAPDTAGGALLGSVSGSAAAAAATVATDRLGVGLGPASSGAGAGAADVRGRREPSGPLAQILESEARVPLDKVVLVVGVWVGVIVLSMVKGGHGAPSVMGVETCSATYWLVVLAAFPGAYAVTAYVGKKLRAEHERKLALRYPFARGDIHWTSHATSTIPLYSFGAGVAAGLMGIGGGMIKGPLLLELGVDPSTASATSGFMILFTSSSTVAQYVVLGQLEMTPALWFATVGFFSALVGQFAISAAIERTGSKALIAYLLAVVIGASTVLLVSTGWMNVMDDLARGVDMGFSSPCH